MSSQLKKTFILIDFIGPICGFEDGDSLRFRSLPGAIFSTVIVISVFVISFMFGKEIYEKKTPIITVSNDYLANSEIKLNEFPLILEFTSGKGDNIKAFNTFLELFTIKIIMDSKNRVTQIDDEIGLVDCRLKIFKNNTTYVKQLLEQFPNKKYFCLNFNDESKFQNEYYSSDSINYNIGFRMCEPRYDPLTPEEIEKYNEPGYVEDSRVNYKELRKIRDKGITPKCKMPLTEEQRNNPNYDHKKMDFMMTLYYMNSYIDYNNFVEPIRYNWESVNHQLNYIYFKRSYMRFTINKFFSDNGILFEDFIDYDFTVLQSIVPDDMLVSKEGFEKDMLYQLSLESPRLRISIKRQYMKAQDLLAKIGGVMNGILISAKILTYHYLRFLYIYYVRDLTRETVEQGRFAYKHDKHASILKTQNYLAANTNINKFDPKNIYNLNSINSIRNNKSLSKLGFFSNNKNQIPQYPPAKKNFSIKELVENTEENYEEYEDRKKYNTMGIFPRNKNSSGNSKQVDKPEYIESQLSQIEEIKESRSLSESSKSRESNYTGQMVSMSIKYEDIPVITVLRKDKNESKKNEKNRKNLGTNNLQDEYMSSERKLFDTNRKFNKESSVPNSNKSSHIDFLNDVIKEKLFEPEESINLSFNEKDLELKYRSKSNNKGDDKQKSQKKKTSNNNLKSNQKKTKESLKNEKNNKPKNEVKGIELEKDINKNREKKAFIEEKRAQSIKEKKIETPNSKDKKQVQHDINKLNLSVEVSDVKKYMENEDLIRKTQMGYLDYLCSIIFCRTNKSKLYKYQMDLVKHSISFRILTNLLIGYILEDTDLINN